MTDNELTSPSDPDLYEEIVRVRASGERAALATVIGTRGSTPGKETMRLLVKSSGDVLGTVGGGCVEADVIDAALDVLESDRPQRLTFRLTENATGQTGLMCGGELEVFIEPISVPQLVLFGAGHISKDLCDIATRAGFRVTVVDDRTSFANRARFPQAGRIVAADTFADCFRQLHLGPHAYCVVVTRGHAMDMTCLEYALGTPAGYVGLIGSRVKIRNILTRLGSEGRLDGVDLERLHAPIGIDLGGSTHGEIAVSVVGELVAHRRGRLGKQSQMRIETESMRRILERQRRPAPASEAAARPSPAPTRDE